MVQAVLYAKSIDFPPKRGYKINIIVSNVVKKI